jgi:hypothetical protein
MPNWSDWTIRSGAAATRHSSMNADSFVTL